MQASKHIRATLIIVFMGLLCTTRGAALPAPFDPTPKHIIMIMLDGFRPDYVTLYAPPNLQRLIAEGAWVAEARSIFPSMTTPNQTSFVTGALPHTTGIPNNSRYDRQLDRIISPLRDNKALTIAEVLSENDWSTASVNHFMLEKRGAQLYVRGNMTDVIRLLDTKRPGLVVYYNAQTDTAGHLYGPFHPGMRQAVLEADAEIGQLLLALDRLGIADETTLVIASDHGMSPNGGLSIISELTALARSGWRLASDNTQIRQNTDLVYIASGSIFLYWRNGKKTPEREAALLHALAEIEGADIYTAEDLVKLGADPERVGDIVIAPHPGYSLGGSSSGGKHGTPAEMQTTLLFWGTGIKPASILHQADIIDIVPTLLTLAKVDIPSTVDGRTLHEIINRTTWKNRLGIAGDHQVKDVAASHLSLTNLPANIADNSTFSVWQAPIHEPGQEEATIIVDYGTGRQIAVIDIVSGPGDEPAGPKQCTIDVSMDGQSFTTVFAGQLKPAKQGETESVRLTSPIRARYVRLTITSGWHPTWVQVAELRAWANSPGSNN